MNIRPLSDHIVALRIEEAEKKRAGGLVIPDTAKDKPMTVKVVAVGAGRMHDSGERVPPDVEKGAKVLNRPIRRLGIRARRRRLARPSRGRCPGHRRVANAVRLERGRNVVIDKKFGSPVVTKDGVTVAKEVDLENPMGTWVPRWRRR